MTIWRWVFKIAIQIIPILLGIDWARPKQGERLMHRPRGYKKRKFF